MEKSVRGLRVVDTANGQQPRNRMADLQLARKDVRGLIVAGEAFP
jgi:hypothetical protein